MTPSITRQLCVPLAVFAAGVFVSAQTLLPSVPPKQFGGSVTAAFEGWYDNPDGSHSFLIGYFSRNTQAELDVPIGANNHFEPGTADLGQPTHFLPGRRYGMFTYTMPKEFGKQQKLSWVLTSNGMTTTVPFYMSPDYNITPSKSSEESPGGGYNLPPLLRFSETGPSFAGPFANPARAIARTAMVGEPMKLDFWADDDAKHSSGSNAPLLRARNWRGGDELRDSGNNALLLRALNWRNGDGLQESGNNGLLLCALDWRNGDRAREGSRGLLVGGDSGVGMRGDKRGPLVGDSGAGRTRYRSRLTRERNKGVEVCDNVRALEREL